MNIRLIALFILLARPAHKPRRQCASPCNREASSGIPGARVRDDLLRRAHHEPRGAAEERPAAGTLRRHVRQGAHALPATHDPRDARAEERQRRPLDARVRPGEFQILRAHARHRQGRAGSGRPDIQFFATLYTPPPWMKTNNAEGGGGKAKATLKPRLELELAEYRLGVPRPHGPERRGGAIPRDLQRVRLAARQPGCFFTPGRARRLFETVGEYLDKMARQISRCAAREARRARTRSARPAR